MQTLSIQEISSVSGGNGWSAGEMGHATGLAIGSAISAAYRSSYELGIWIYDISH